MPVAHVHWPDRVDWRAARDGEAHAIVRRATRTVCERVPVDERYAWPPVRGRCTVCLEVLKRVEGAMPQR